jgi:hypothetical protein
MLAMAGEALDQLPPPVALLRVLVKPMHELNVPVIAAGVAFTL